MREHEVWLWSMLAEVESSTLGRYQAAASALNTPAKRAAVERVKALSPDASPLAHTPLADAVPSLLTAAAGDGSAGDVLWIQGIVLEHLGGTLYRAIADGGRLSREGTAVAQEAAAASDAVLALAAHELCVLHPSPSERFQAFAARTRPVFSSLDGLGLALDDAFSEPLNLPFADLMGDFVADLLPTCTADLGFERRKVMAHLTSALMV